MGPSGVSASARFTGCVKAPLVDTSATAGTPSPGTIVVHGWLRYAATTHGVWPGVLSRSVRIGWPVAGLSSTIEPGAPVLASVKTQTRVWETAMLAKRPPNREG